MDGLSQFRSRANISLVWLLFPLFALSFTWGCSAPFVRSSALRWNLRSQIDGLMEPAALRPTSALELASRSHAELVELMTCCRVPEPEELMGTWAGVNKGYGAALAALHQDIKVFREADSRGCVTGYNILVEQVPVQDLCLKGWKAKRDPVTCEPKTIGNFVASTSRDEGGERSMLLDYSKGDNPLLDPSRYLVDELVVVAPGLMLGRAKVRFGMVEVPVAWFALSRMKSVSLSECDGIAE